MIKNNIKLSPKKIVFASIVAIVITYMGFVAYWTYSLNNPHFDRNAIVYTHESSRQAPIAVYYSTPENSRIERPVIALVPPQKMRIETRQEVMYQETRVMIIQTSYAQDTSVCYGQNATCARVISPKGREYRYSRESLGADRSAVVLLGHTVIMLTSDSPIAMGDFIDGLIPAGSAQLKKPEPRPYQAP